MVKIHFLQEMQKYTTTKHLNNMEKQQTAVEWLFLMMNNPNKDQELANKLYDKAKEIEQEQIMNAWVKGVVSEGDMTARQYYNETYKQEE